MSEEELRVVADNLRRWQSEIGGHRMSKVVSPGISAILEQRLAELGQLEAAKQQGAADARRQAELEALYGEAVRRVPGAEVQDLLILDKISALLVELAPDATPNYLMAALSGGTYLDEIRKQGSSDSRAPKEGDNRFTPLAVNDDGSYVFSAHKSIPFAPDGRWEEISRLVTELIQDSGMTGRKVMRRSADPYPDAWATQVSQAVDLKRRGEFLASAKIYDELCRKSGVLYTGIIASLYKSVTASGALLSGNFLLINGEFAIQNDPKAAQMTAQQGPSTFVYHLARLQTAINSEPQLEAYLRDICGNVNYRLPRDFTEAVSELNEHNAKISRQFEKLDRAERASKAGCYVATAVYGSYDAPPVLTLRRFRDRRLALSAHGRAFIRIYYAVSPQFARRLERATPLNAAVRRVLDILVQHLDARGYSCT